MVGGLTQLVCKGQLDSYINVKPDISFYKFAYKKHTNFAFESIRLDFDIIPFIDKKNAIFKCKLNRKADILNKLYLVFKLPDIYSNDKYRFRWLKNVGTLMIRRATVTIGSTILDVLSGEWMLIENELSLNVKDSYNEITGNLKNMYNPSLPLPVIKINNNKFFDSTYPVGNKNLNIPSIKEKEVFIPLNFNFTKNPSLGLLLLKLQAAEIFLTVEFEDIENLYQVYFDKLNMYISPKYYNELNPNDIININTFILSNNLHAYVEGSFTYLDNDERALFMIDSITTILIEQLFISNIYSIKAGNKLSSITDLLGANNHNKEIIWTLRRDDYFKFNNITNYTNSIIEDKNSSILDSAIINFNRTNFIEQKDAKFFNIIQPYQYHTCIPKQGIYVYSFALYPEKWQPTGSYNGACLITSLNLFVNNANNTIFNEILNKNNYDEYTYNYELRYYIKNHNILEYKNGIAGIKYV